MRSIFRDLTVTDMRRGLRLSPLLLWCCLGVAIFALGGCETAKKPEVVAPLPTAPASPPTPAVSTLPDNIHPVALGIDVLEASGFAAVKGKTIGLLTHPAGVNRRGELTIDVLRRAPQTKLIRLFGPEHGIYGTEKASVPVQDAIDARTGLPVFSLYGENRKPSAAQLQGLDALVIDLQDIGVRSYTFNVVMRYAMDACFLHGVEVIVLDRPNPLGGLKVDGPLLDREWRSGVGAFPMPYVHGLTMGELARYAADTPGVMDVPEEVRAKGRLTVVPLRGWRRSMRWPETGLTFVPTSQNVRDFPAVIGYAMVGLGCEYSGFQHGIGTPNPFRNLSFAGKTAARLESELAALKIPGVHFRQLEVVDAKGQKSVRVRPEVAKWEEWNPTDLSFHLMRLACRYNPPNPFVKLTPAQAELFNKHVGSTAWWNALRRDGARIDVEKWLQEWRAQAAAFQQQTKKYWLYE
ncbi:MAG: DUF1343 domain-containing protein [Opitutaceae bacterium]